MQGETPRVIRSWLWNTLMAFSLAFVPLGVVALIVAAIFDPDAPATHSRTTYALVAAPWIGLLLAVSVGVSVRPMMMGVYATPHGLRIRKLFFTRTVPWPNLNDIHIETTYGPRGTYYQPVISFYERTGRRSTISCWMVAAMIEKTAAQRVELLGQMCSPTSPRCTTCCGSGSMRNANRGT